MDRQALKDARHHMIGYIDTAADGKQACRDARYHVVGYYDPLRTSPGMRAFA